ncbi:hypothetical protein Dsin_001331 [Dipteronia sinensis]|uniref:DUF4283 domain-containing protein n=1 Tax=Dipteronia sinensis TaxID=43782 RepID=A0AAE0EK73_9ROSI|nr:hypothetical protein Dsin_001331 [Dipteronia sinensis]
MNEMFVFSTHQEVKNNEVMKEKPHDTKFNAKRARAQEDIDDSYLRKTTSVSFKSKLLGSASLVIANQYLVVQKWRPNFVPSEDEIRQMPVWVRLSKRSMEWIDVDLLWNIGGMLGNTCKGDPITESQVRGRFVRICIEIDIAKPLKGALIIDDRIIKVENKSLGLICFKC